MRMPINGELGVRRSQAVPRQLWRRGGQVSFGPIASLRPSAGYFRTTPINRHFWCSPACLKGTANGQSTKSRRRPSPKTILSAAFAIINDEGHEIGNVPIYSKLSYKTPPIKVRAPATLRSGHPHTGRPHRLSKPLKASV